MPRENNGTITIKDIAEACDVSISTVSNVLNGKSHKVSDRVADRVREELERTGYRPSYPARSLRAKSTRTIGVIAEDLIIFSSPAIIEGIMSCCEEHSYGIVIENMRLFGRWHGEWLQKEGLFDTALENALAKMDTMNLDGLIYVGGHEHMVNRLSNARELPVVLTYASTQDSGIPTFRLDDVSGGYEVIRYLVSMGHRRIGVIAGEYDNAHTINRLRGYHQAIFEENILFDPELVVYREWNKKGGYDGMLTLLDKNITAVFCMSDLIASGAYAALYEHGLRPGSDISVMGYDDQEIASCLTPELTTMALPLHELGFGSASALISMIEHNGDNGTEPIDVHIGSRLVERRSVKRLTSQ